jgi:hypothetical protein
MNWLLLSLAVIGIGAMAARRYAPWLEQMLASRTEAAPGPPVLRATTELDHLVATLRNETDPLERHRLLRAIVEQSHSQRADAAMKKVFLRFAGMQVEELPQMAAALKAANGGRLPAVPAFELLAAVLEEEGRREEAASVRKQAEDLGLIERVPVTPVGRTRKTVTRRGKARPAVKRTPRAKTGAGGRRKRLAD